MLDKSNTIQSLADVRDHLSEQFDPNDKRLKAHLSAISRIATFLNRAEADVPTNIRQLRHLLCDLHPAQCGLKPQSLSSLKSQLAAALRTAEVLHDRSNQMALTLYWQTYLDQVETHHQRHGVIRFARFCSAKGYAPKDVCDAVVEAFAIFLDTHLLTGDPGKQIKYLINNWNHLNQKHEFGLRKLSYSRSDRFLARPLTIYPESLQKDVEAYLTRVGHQNLFDDDAPDKPLKPMSLRNIEAHIRQLLDALVETGSDPAEFECLRDVITIANIKRGLQAIVQRSGKNTVPTSLGNISGTTIAIARHYLKLEDMELAGLKKIRKKVDLNPSGMSAKNSERLTQFNDYRNVVLLVSLPQTLMDRAEQAPADRKSALLAMYAVAIVLLLCCPMRIKNLAALDIDKHLIAHGSGVHAKYTIRVEGNEVKNGQALEFNVNKVASKILHRYIKQYRPLLSDHRSSALFPRLSDGQARTPDNFGKGITDCIKRETGLDVHPHLFRHLAAKLYLQAHPGNFEVVRRLLKHTTLQTTMGFYAEISNRWAHDHYDEEVLGKWGMKDE